MNCPPLLAITDRPEHADAHWRVVRPLARLREAGVDAAICWLDADEMPTVSPAGRVVILQRVVVKGGDEAAVRRWVQRLRDAGALAVVFEMDDDVVSPAYGAYLEACGGLEMVSRRRLMDERQALEWAMRASDAVTVSTEPLAEVVRGYTTAPVHVLPNAIDVEWFRARLAPRPEWADTLTIGWAGGRRPEADLEPMARAWARIAQRYPDVRFVVAGWQSDVIYRELDAVDAMDRIVRVPWLDLDRYPEAYQVDIGCTPLADTPFNRCKSPIKAYEYALAGAATIGSELLYGAHVSQAADTADEWENVLSLWIESPEWRQKTNGWMQEYVDRHHSLTANVHHWADTYREIAASVGAVRA